MNHYTQETFIENSKKIHGDKYDYSKVEYVNTNVKVCIVCPEHGEFWITPSGHMRGRGCKECAKISRKLKSSDTTENFITKAQKVHGNKYDYSKVEYIDSQTKVCIICPKHGEFWQTPNGHLRGSGCAKCANETRNINKKDNTKIFIEKAQKVHGDKYDYSKVEYINSDTKVCIICPEHGEFWQIPYNHLIGKGCPKCGRIEQWNKRGRGTTTDFIVKAQKIHGNKYEYNKTIYVNSSTPLTITCPIHGDFQQIANDHLTGKGCYYCGLESQINKRTMPLSDFISKANEVHNNKYLYSKVEYTNANTKVCITCPEHGDFWQIPYVHLTGCGCPKCANCGTSTPESEINDFINNELGIETITNERKLLNGLEVDILIPSHALAIEYDGLYWHSEMNGKDMTYHLNKTNIAESKGYHLIHIFEDEWIEHKDIVLERIRHILHCDNKRIVGARKCDVKLIGKETAKTFLNTYHIQGYVGATLYYGSFLDNKLVGVMSFKQESKDKWNLNRFATDTTLSLPGIANKLLKHFINDNNPIEIKTFLDRRWSYSDSNVYDKMGFELDKVERPDYRYVVGLKRLHKFGFRKEKLSSKYNLPLTMTESEMTKSLGISRIWDCGLYKYVWRNIQQS